MRLRPAVLLCTLCASLLGGCQDVTNVLKSGNSWIEVQNLRFTTLRSVYAQPCTGGPEGDDRLEADVEPGSLRVFLIAPGCYDVIGDFADGRRIVQDVRTYANVESRVVFED